MKESFSILFDYAVGTWVTAWARYGLWQLVTGCFGEVDPTADHDSFYYDTDSNKFINGEKHEFLVEHINEKNRQAIKEVCEYYNLDEELFSPLDKKGKAHTIGALEYEGTFLCKTLGAKKYMCEFEDGHREITISGVPKSGVCCMTNGFNDFDNGFEFPYQWKNKDGVDVGKINMIYDESQTPFSFIDSEGHEYFCGDIQYSIIAQPTTYTLGLTEEYESLIEMLDSNIYF